MNHDVVRTMRQHVIAFNTAFGQVASAFQQFARSAFPDHFARVERERRIERHLERRRRKQARRLKRRR